MPARLAQAASTDKDAISPVHPGAKVYYDGEETTLMERYGDWLFYGPMLLGALGSVLVAIMRFLGVQQASQAPPVLSRVPEVIASIQDAGTLAELDAIRTDIDAAVAQLAAEAERGAIDPHRTAIFALAVNHVDNVLAQRRDTLLREGGAASSRSGRINAAE